MLKPLLSRPAASTFTSSTPSSSRPLLRVTLRAVHPSATRSIHPGGVSWRPTPLHNFYFFTRNAKPFLRQGIVSAAASSSAPTSGTMLFRQLFEKESSTYTYILADVDSPGKPAIIIDPVDLTADRDADMIKELGLTLVYCCNTHVHADHITGTGLLKQKIPGCKSVISKVSTAKADVLVEHGDKVKFGNLSVEVRATPGHTAGCISYVTSEEGAGAPSPRWAFTGDALLIRGCGRTDFQGGDSRGLYKSVHSQILSLPAATKLYPAHDYKGRMETSVEEEKLHNARLTKTEDEFVEIMANLGLPYPKKIDASLPANLVCGIQD